MQRMSVICLMLVATAACTSAVPVPTGDDAKWATRQWPETSVETLSGGRSLYVSRCAGCHALVPPAKHSGDRWLQEVPRMTQRAHLDDGERDLITRYLLTASRPRDAAQR